MKDYFSDSLTHHSIMIKGLYETHLNVTDLERSMDFYANTIGLEHCHFDKARRIAFYWIGKPRQQMLGLWEKPKDQVQIQHFAFECEPDWVLHQSVDYLNDRNLSCYNFLNDGTKRPMVFAWMPAISIYFDDPDGHSLEFIGVLPGKPQSELGVISYEDWMQVQTSSSH